MASDKYYIHGKNIYENKGWQFESDCPKKDKS